MAKKNVKITLLPGTASDIYKALGITKKEKEKAARIIKLLQESQGEEPKLPFLPKKIEKQLEKEANSVYSVKWVLMGNRDEARPFDIHFCSIMRDGLHEFYIEKLVPSPKASKGEIKLAELFEDLGQEIVSNLYFKELKAASDIKEQNKNIKAFHAKLKALRKQYDFSEERFM